MKMLLNVLFPHEPFNTLVRKGEAGTIIKKILDDLKPEAVYFTEQDGHRSVLLIVEVAKSHDIPKFAEPFFLHFDADCRIRTVMSPDDLAKAGLDQLGKKWA